MAKNKTSTNSKQRAQTWKGFVNFSLGATDKKNIKQMVDDGIDPLPQLQEIIEEGYDIKLAWDSFSDCISVMLLGKTCKNGNMGWGMSCRHTDVSVAAMGAIYQHTQLSGEDNEWPKPSDMQSEHDW